MTLKRLQYRKDGVFSELFDKNGTHVAYTLEHSYDNGNSGWAPKIPLGQYVCILGTHQLHNMVAPFQTFEITGVTGHTNLLFHAGNFDKDSEGCILLGDAITKQANGDEMVTNSKTTFEKFMNGLAGVKEFMLTVQNV